MPLPIYPVISPSASLDWLDDDDDVFIGPQPVSIDWLDLAYHVLPVTTDREHDSVGDAARWLGLEGDLTFLDWRRKPVSLQDAKDMLMRWWVLSS